VSNAQICSKMRQYDRPRLVGEGMGQGKEGLKIGIGGGGHCLGCGGAFWL
jgi:hypothetical protein